jgi:FkbM family methyltransferase
MSDPAPAIGIRIAGGVTVVVPARIDLLTPYVLLEQEDWFEDEIRFLRARLAPGSRCVDIGANYGCYTLALAKAAGPAGRVWSVEPSSGTAAWLRQSVEINEFAHVTIVQKALSDRIGTARLSIEANSELNSLSGGGSGPTEEVPLTTLDTLAAEHDWDGIDFVKLDAEGEEERIVAGGAKFFAAHSPLVMFEIRHGERLNLALVDRLASVGYAPYRLLSGENVLAPWDPATPLDPFQLNLFACKPDRAALLERSGALRKAPAPALEVRADDADAQTLAECAHKARALGERHAAAILVNRALGCCKDPALFASLLGNAVTLGAYSGYFVGEPARRDTMLRQLEAIKASGHMTAPMERRRQLLRVFAGLQAGPEPNPLLGIAAPDNRNPELWTG